MVLTPISAWQFECGKETDERELARSGCSELRAAIGGTLIRDTKCRERALELVHQTLEALLCPFDGSPVGIAVHSNELIHSLVV